LKLKDKVLTQGFLKYFIWLAFILLIYEEDYSGHTDR